MVYDRKTIYDYMDGGAEVYLAFDFREVFVRKYIGPSRQEEIALDIFDMGSPEEAYGVFSCDRQDPEAGIGQESEYGPGLLRFWQGRFFVSMTASGDEPSRGKSRSSSWGKRSRPGSVRPAPFRTCSACLPEAGLKKNRTSYFHAAVNLNNRFFVASENILNLDGKTGLRSGRVCRGPGKHGRSSHRPLSRRRPGAGGLSFLPRKPIFRTPDPTGAALTENRKWTMARAFAGITWPSCSKRPRKNTRRPFSPPSSFRPK